MNAKGANMATALPPGSLAGKNEAARLRAEIRAGRHTGPTAGLALSWTQANVVIVPSAAAGDFGEFCRSNARACPLLDQTVPGDPHPPTTPTADLRCDVPRYRVFRRGVAEATEPIDIFELWRDDLVAFLLGCSFTFERALAAAGLAPRHWEARTNVPMYRTNRACQPAGRFAGPLVVSMRPYRLEDVTRVTAVTVRFPRMHGSPIQVGDPGALGIKDLSRPDFGDPVEIRAGEVPLFWACGVTPQLALAGAGCDLAITHSPGCMFVTDLPESAMEEDPQACAEKGGQTG
ncbi:MAG TPA: putative hydro-lyase [Pirellulales bacterium]|nr:putative hydro-lyase [Pirellulales bacterium]